MNPHLDRPENWPLIQPLIIAHDVGRSRDRSTAVVGGGSPFQSSVVGILELQELPQKLYGSARANALATIDRHYNGNALIIADLSNDATYAEVLLDTFGCRVIGLQITRSGDGMCCERRPAKNGSILVYTVGRSYLLETLHTELQARHVRFVDGPMSRRAYEQLAGLQVELRDSGTVYACAPGRHDDLGMSCAMLVWASRHPHLPSWFRSLVRSRMPRRRQPPFTAKAWT